jgi:hypothetical protein
MQSAPLVSLAEYVKRTPTANSSSLCIVFSPRRAKKRYTKFDDTKHIAYTGARHRFGPET